MNRASSAEPDTRRPAAVRVLLGLLLLHGVSAVGGGGVFLADPTGELAGMDTSMLTRTPFTTFRWPGALLAVGLGIPALVTAIGLSRRTVVRAAAPLERASGQHWSWAGSIVVGVTLVIWIVVQLWLLDERTVLQPLMLGIGLALAGLPLAPPVRSDLAVARTPR